MRSQINFIIDFILLLLLAAIVWTGLIMRFLLPPGYRGCSGWTLWGLSRHDYGHMHFALSVVMLVFCGLHLALHWQWFQAKINRIIRYKGKSLAAALIVILVMALSIGSVFILGSQVYKAKPRSEELRAGSVQSGK